MTAGLASVGFERVPTITMCGIAGFWNTKPGSASELKAIACQMAERLVHRGPDDAGVWMDPAVGLALSFRRLAIFDVSPSGHQPMVSRSGRYVIVFNGEVYNFHELRKELESHGHVFRSQSDTEVILAAVTQWGLEPAVARFVGMFAFALWDRQHRNLHLVRDRLGIKPLYYGWTAATFFFASEPRALRAYPGWTPEINRDALALHMRYSYIPQPHSIYRGIYKLPPGCIWTIHSGGPRGSGTPRPYWSAKEVAEGGAQSPLRCSHPELIERLDHLLRDAVRLRMRADVPLGAFLSGGVDSSTVAALMQAQSGRPIKTYTIGFHENEYDEARYASLVARHLGTTHTEFYVTPRETLAVIPKLPALYDEPFSDSSQIPTHLVSCLARREVTVSLSGDGGDEVFGGYNRYFWFRRMWRVIEGTPAAWRGFAAWGLQRLPPRFWNRLFSTVDPLVPARLRVRLPGDKIHKLANLLGSRRPEELYLRLVSQWFSPDAVVLGANHAPHVLSEPSLWPKLSDFTRLMMYLDLVSYLPDDILTKVDRASMGVGLEARVPLLDHRVVEFSSRLPLNLKVNKGVGKRILRQVLERYLPPEMMERPKMGFGVPVGKWLCGPLREWAEDLLDLGRLKREGYLRPEPIRQLWAEHLAGHRDWQYSLWPVLMFEAWLEHWGAPGWARAESQGAGLCACTLPPEAGSDRQYGSPLPSETGNLCAS